MKIILLAIFILLNACSYSIADTHVAATCSQADVQTAVDAASNGDTVSVPAGSCTWTTTVANTPSVSISKSITLQGAGIDSTIITDATAYASNTNEAAIKITGAAGRTVRVTGFTFTSNANVDTTGTIAIRGTDFWKSFRIDHIKSTLEGPLVVVYAGYGLIDHVQFIHTISGRYSVVLYGAGINSSWASFTQPNPTGTDNAVYIEDSTFTCSTSEKNIGSIDMFEGANLVARFNTFTNTGALTHDTAYDNQRGARHYEWYNNTFTSSTTTPLARTIHLRSGTGVIYNNTINGNYNYPVEVANYRTSDEEDHAAIVSHWGYCDGSNTCDQNTGTLGYPCMDQIGRITDTQTVTCNTSHGVSGQGPNQALEPLYQWNNTFQGSAMTIHVSSGCRTGGSPCNSDHIKAGRDYYDETAKPGYIAYVYPHPLQGIKRCPFRCIPQ